MYYVCYIYVTVAISLFTSLYKMKIFFIKINIIFLYYL